MVATLLMNTIASDQVIDEAYAWLCERRKDYAPDADVRHWRRWVTGGLGLHLQAGECIPIAGARAGPAGPTPGYRGYCADDFVSS